VNSNNLRTKYIKAIEDSYDHKSIVYSLNKIGVPDNGYILCARGVKNLKYEILHMIASDPLKKYNLIPTISLLPLFLRKEALVISFYNSVMLNIVLDNKDKFPLAGKHNIKLQDVYNDDIIIIPSFGERNIAISDYLMITADVIYSVFKSYNENKKDIIGDLLKSIDNYDIYIINAAVLGKLNLVYYPLDKSEFNTESIYSVISPKCVYVASAGIEDRDTSIFIKSMLAVRHSSGNAKGIKKTIIETPLSKKEICDLYSIKDNWCSI